MRGLDGASTGTGSEAELLKKSGMSGTSNEASSLDDRMQNRSRIDTRDSMQDYERMSPPSNVSSRSSSPATISESPSSSVTSSPARPSSRASAGSSEGGRRAARAARSESAATTASYRSAEEDEEEDVEEDNGAGAFGAAPPRP